MEADLEVCRTLCSSLAGLHDISAFLVTPTGEIVFECVESRLLNPLYRNDKQNLFALLNFDPVQHYDFPVIRRTVLFESYILVSVMRNQEFKGTVILGPALARTMAEPHINGLISDFDAFSTRDHILHYYMNLSILPKEKLIHLALLVHASINGVYLPFEEISARNDQLMRFPDNLEATRLTFEKTESFEAPHHDPLLEKQLLALIREGRVDELKTFTVMSEEATGVLSKSSHIRSQKNLGIVAIAICARAAIDGGVYSEIAFSLSDRYIQRLEDLSSVKEIDKLQMEAIFTFASKVAEAREQKYTTTVTACQNYVYSNRFEKITHEDIAKAVRLSPNYLSVLFKKEVGLSVGEYIQKVKVDEAKNLIAYTATSLSEISSLLQFTDQSYFTKIFKKIEGITPKQYKERHRLL
ncbi:helix-turn-helix domain-containing protein [Saccharibacillus endophyticus]|uniref:AraC family transcriptional regulator n=1 Tax=Saccharibacillus endophyticus TaxID=2060666 RepID=A0ABQ1ZMK2_9BACL|nr:helix-turn-helix domain-containing protein [Saccharibacillus endophyticus]GGH69674.1 AraC family transcriptional regulator [Saccharibacillus endophyticus]